MLMAAALFLLAAIRVLSHAASPLALRALAILQLSTPPAYHEEEDDGTGTPVCTSSSESDSDA